PLVKRDVLGALEDVGQPVPVGREDDVPDVLHAEEVVRGHRTAAGRALGDQGARARDETGECGECEAPLHHFSPSTIPSTRYRIAGTSLGSVNWTLTTTGPVCAPGARDSRFPSADEKSKTAPSPRFPFGALTTKIGGYGYLKMSGSSRSKPRTSS